MNNMDYPEGSQGVAPLPGDGAPASDRSLSCQSGHRPRRPVDHRRRHAAVPSFDSEGWRLGGTGDGAASSHREVLLVVLPNGQRAHVVAAFDAKRMDLITVWCPDAPENALKWQPHALLPTRSGAYGLPPTHWYLGDPTRPDRHLAGAR